MRHLTRSRKMGIAAAAAMIIACGLPAAGQPLPPWVGDPTFSVDFQGPTPRTPIPDAFFGAPIGAADILSGPLGGPPIGSPGMGPLPPPGMVVHGGPPWPNPGLRTLGLAPGAFPVPWPNSAEVDALSYGRDKGDRIYFSVDEFAAGDPLGPGPAPPNVFTEGIVGNNEASADVFHEVTGLFGFPGLLRFARQWGLPPFPMPVPPGGNTAYLDGNGLPPTGLPGVGLVEPNAPVPWPNPGDNLDALNIDTVRQDIAGPIYFSLDTSDPFGPDPVAGPNTGSALANNFAGGDILVNPAPGAANLLYAPAPLLGLDIGGRDTDDLDALILVDDGDMVYTPGTDFLAFSVRRHSHVTWGFHNLNPFPGINLDSIWGAPIEEGDILVPPGTFLPWFGVVPGPTPGILVPGEWLGLWTVRSYGPQPRTGPFGDELDALDVEPVVPEPCSFALLGAGVAALLARRRRKRLA